MNRSALSSVSLSFGRIALLAIASTGAVVASAEAQNANGWPSNNIAVRGESLPAGQVVDLRCGVSHTIALLKDGTLFLRGRNALSNGFPCNMPGGCDYVAIAAGYNHSLALRSNGTIVGAGTNLFGELNAPTWLNDAVALAAGDKFSGAIRANGTIVLWGSSAHGKTIAPMGLTEVVKLSLGQDHGIALRANGEVRCWGRNTNMQAPSIVIDPTTGSPLIARDIAAGDKHSVALRTNGTVFAWGLAKSCNVPVGLVDAVAVAAGPGQSVALRSSGAVAAWGNPRMNPPAFNNAVKVAAGRAFGYALTDDAGLQAPAVLQPVSTNAESCANPTGSVSLTIEDAPIRWWTGPNGFFSTREDLSGLGQGTYTLHLRGAGGEAAIAYTIDAPDALTWYTDVDGDGRGSPLRPTARDCSQPVGMVALDGDDCDDNASLLSEEEFYADTDADGFGDPDEEIESCTEIAPPGYVENDEDCNDEDFGQNPQTIWYRDVDGDGVGSPISGIKQQCEQPEGYFRSGTDNCPQNPDLTDPVRFYYDGDHDGFGNSEQFFDACSTVPPIGYVTNSDDCNDNALLYADTDGDGFGAGAPAACGVANNTDGCPDNPALQVPATFYRDADSDSFGDPANSVAACSANAPAGYVVNNTDCNDNALLYADSDGDGFGAGAPAACGVPTNTDLCPTNAALQAPITYYFDGDSDSFGNLAAPFQACSTTPPIGYVANSADCDDTKLLYADADGDGFGAGSPAACGVANNTDGCPDNGSLQSPVTYYRDADNDTFGDSAVTTSVCSTTAPAGYVTNSADCNDNALLYADTDGDGFGAGSPVACGVANNTDGCPDNGSLQTPVTYYRDADNDTFGNLNDTTSVCSTTAPAGYVTNSADCDDTKLLYADTDGDGSGAGAPVACGVANNTDLCPTNPALQTPRTFYFDSDGDGYGNPAQSFEACSTTPPIGYVGNDDDCNDANNAVFPGAAELCATVGVDNNCDGSASDVDANAADKVDFYRDADNDGFTTAETAKFCSGTANAGWRSVPSAQLDCNDGDNTTFPGAAELCASVGVDNNCDANVSDVDADAADKVDFHRDADNDGFTTGETAKFCPGTVNAGWRSTSSAQVDCNDGDNAVFPGAVELCATVGIDNNCDANVNDVDAGAADKVDFFRDADDDGFTTAETAKFCAGTVNAGWRSAPSAQVDCNDSDNSVFPGAAELCATVGVDNNCDTNINDVDANAADKVDFYRDADGDTYTTAETTKFCPGTSNPGWRPSPSAQADCNDADGAINPGATENCANLGTDNDCDGVDDASEAVDAVNYYADADGDGFGANTGAPIRSCSPVAGSVSNNLDCDDNFIRYADVDGDGFGSDTKVPCGGVLNTEDCDDALVTYDDVDGDGFGYGAATACGIVTNNVDCYPTAITYADADADGFGFGPMIPCGAVTNNEDCDDNRVAYSDLDGDGFGSDAKIPCGGVLNSDDCDDAVITYADTDGDGFGAGTPVACGVGNDDDQCPTNGALQFPIRYYPDVDGDLYGNGAAAEDFCSTTPPAGYVEYSGDCDDASATVYPGAAELCSTGGVDNNCDGNLSDIDADAADKVDFYRDADGDTFTTGETQKFCPGTANDGWRETASASADCDDASNVVYPGAVELCSTVGVDNNCDANVSDVDAEAADKVDYYRDADGDTFTTAETSKFCPGTTNDGWRETASASADCDDASNVVYPGAVELCSTVGVDNNCDTNVSDIDADAADKVAYYKDADGDTFTTADTQTFCPGTTNPGWRDAPSADLDCDDSLFLYADADGDGFGAGEPAACGVANNTDGCPDVFELQAPVTYYRDADSDSFGNTWSTVTVCSTTLPEGYVTNDDDCDDDRVEYADSDNDGFGYGPMVPCFGVTNNSDCEPTQITYADNDGDGFGAGPMVPCGAVTNNTDCDDSAARTYPGATEVCGDGVDNDCNGTVDDSYCVPFELSLESGTTSIQFGTPVVVTAVATAPPKPLRGMQLVVSWDTTALEFEGVLPHPDSPFTEVVGEPIIDTAAGTLQYMLVAPVDGPSMTTEAVLCNLAFTARGSFCEQAALVRFTEVDGFGTEFAAINGGEVVSIVPILTDLGVIDVDATNPVLGSIPDFSSVIPADAGRVDGAFLAEPVVTATDDCADSVSVVSDWPEDGRFPIGSTVVTWTATDSVGNTATAQRTITVGNFQLLDLSACLAGVVLPDGATRQIRVTIQGVTTLHTVVFSDGCAVIPNLVVAPVAIDPGCILAKDPVHSLAKSASASVNGTEFEASVLLIQGDSDDDNKVDVIDYALWESDLGTGVAQDARSNFNGDTVIDLADRTFVVESVWRSGDSCTTGFTDSPIVTRVSVKELRRRGLGHLAVADRNRDGWVDVRDVRLAQSLMPGIGAGN